MRCNPTDLPNTGAGLSEDSPQLGIESDGDSGGGGSAGKVLRVLRTFTSDSPKKTAEAIAREASLPRSSTYRYLSLLRKAGFVEDAGEDRYRLASIIIAMARAAYGALDIVEFAEPYMERLARASQETAILVRRSGDRGVCLGRVESDRRLRITFELGTALPLHRGAAPKVLLANLPEREREQILLAASAQDAAFAGNLDAFRRELALIRQTGFAESSAEITPDVYAVASPVVVQRRVVAALSIVGAAYRIAAEERLGLKKLTLEVASELSRAYDAVNI